MTAFYLKIPPIELQKMASYNQVSDWGFSTVNHFDKYYFVKENNPNLDRPGKSLIFMTKPLGNRLPEKEINFLNGQPALFVYTMKQ
jgi:hypothetical protein